MRTIPLTIQPTCPGHSQNSLLLHLTQSLCTEGHRWRQVWLCLLILGVLCRSTCACIGPTLKPPQDCLVALKHVIKKSDAMLYAPSVDEIKLNCDIPSFTCYMLEVEMVLTEEQIDIKDDNARCIFSFNDQCSKRNANAETNAGSCPPCEATALRNSTIFFENLLNILSKIMSNSQM